MYKKLIISKNRQRTRQIKLEKIFYWLFNLINLKFYK